MEDQTQLDLWKRFEHTGKIEDYLTYKTINTALASHASQEANSPKQPSADGHAIANEDGRTYGNQNPGAGAQTAQYR